MLHGAWLLEVAQHQLVFAPCYYPQSALLFSQQFMRGASQNTTQQHPSLPQLHNKNLFDSCWVSRNLKYLYHRFNDFKPRIFDI